MTTLIPVPQHCPRRRELDDLELILTGALSRSFNAPGSSVTLELPDDLVAEVAAVGEVELVDPEGFPLARVNWPSGEVTPLTLPEYGPFRHLYLAPDETRVKYGGRSFVVVREPLTDEQVADLGPFDDSVLLALVGHRASSVAPAILLRTCLAHTDRVVAVPLAPRDDIDDEVLATFVGDDDMIAVEPTQGTYSGEVWEIVEGARPESVRGGVVVFFTGLSGSGKSTLARALMDRVLEDGRRTVTSLDGDVVRRNLSQGLTFSKEDRDINVKRLGWVAAQIAHHGGMAVCSPIAPFDRVRQQVREMAGDAGGAFFLVHVSTPLEECERRDRKGLYAKARAGLIPEFTGISSPYEVPADADVRIDTTGRTIEDALDELLEALASRKLVDLR